MTTVLLVLVLAVILFCAALLGIFLSIFRRKAPRHLENIDLSKSHYGKYEKELREAIRAARAIPFEPVTVPSGDGLRLFGRFFPGSGRRGAILVHGYHSNAYNNFSCLLPELLRQGYSVLLYDQRAHEESGGGVTTLGCREQDDLLRWVQWIGEREEITEVVLYGISMGSATVGFCSDRIGYPKVKALIMEAGYTSFYDELGWQLRGVPCRRFLQRCIADAAALLLRIDISESTESHLSKTGLPVLFLHGDADTDVPAEFTLRNHKACTGEKELLLCPGVGHTMCFMAGGEAVQNRIWAFLDSHLCK